MGVVLLSCITKKETIRAKTLCLSEMPNCMRPWSLRIRRFIRLALSALHVLAAAVSAALKSRTTLQLENLALRHQLGVLRRSVKRPKLTSVDRLLWAWLCGVWIDWQSSLVIVKPETVIAWHRKGFRLFWTWKVRGGQLGRPFSCVVRTPCSCEINSSSRAIYLICANVNCRLDPWQPASLTARLTSAASEQSC
jgi:hypothetical protein